MPADVVNLDRKLSLFSDHWSPKIVAGFNDCDVMVVKAQGAFTWHHHPDTDDFFLVLKGVEHRPVADEEVHLLLIEPKGVPNTGDAATAVAKEVI